MDCILEEIEVKDEPDVKYGAENTHVPTSKNEDNPTRTTIWKLNRNLECQVTTERIAILSSENQLQRDSYEPHSENQNSSGTDYSSHDVGVPIRNVRPHGHSLKRILTNDQKPYIKSEPETSIGQEYFDHSSVIQRNLKIEAESEEGNEDPLNDGDTESKNNTHSHPLPISVVPFCRNIDIVKAVDSSSVPSSANTPITTKKIDCHFCPFCKKLYDSSADLNNHFWMHARKGYHTCMTCGECFSTKSSLGNHNITHFIERPFRCNSCELNFSTNAGLASHARVHNNNAVKWPKKIKFILTEFGELGQPKITERVPTEIQHQPSYPTPTVENLQLQVPSWSESGTSSALRRKPRISKPRKEQSKPKL